MTDDNDPLYTFFTSAELKDKDILYTTLKVTRDAKPEDLRKAYRKGALRCHPDKHSHKTEAEREVAAAEFQKIGFAWAVLSDEKRRKRYDATGHTEESAFEHEAGWDAYFSDLFDRVDRKILDDDKKRYQGSKDEVKDLRSAYEAHDGSLAKIMELIPHSHAEDETRFIEIIEIEIAKGRLSRTAKWTRESIDIVGRKGRKRKAEAEAKKAEKAAKDLGVWDEFYGSGKKGKRAGEKDEDALQALILGRKKQRTSTLNALEDKYAAIEEKYAKKGKGKKSKEPHPAELDDEAFAALQAKMFK